MVTELDTSFTVRVPKAEKSREDAWALRVLSRGREEALVVTTVSKENFGSIGALDPDSRSVLLPNPRQMEILKRLGINFRVTDLHHPVSEYFWVRLKWFIGRFEKPQHLRNNRRHGQYEKIQDLLKIYFGIKEIHDRKDFLKKIKSLEEEHEYRTVYSIPKVLHAAYNTVFNNRTPENVFKELCSIVWCDNYDRKKRASILTLLYAFAVLEGNGELCLARKESIKNRLDKGSVTMKEVMEELGLDYGTVKSYIELFFLPRNYKQMKEFFNLLEEMCKR
jgi:hypothetical protein